MNGEKKQYEIRTIRDLFAVASKTKDVDGLFTDLQACALMALELSNRPEIDSEELLNHFSCFRWTDDGIRKGEVKIIAKE